MHIVHVYKDYFPVLGGIENHLRTLAEAQAAAGHQVTVLVCALGQRTEHLRLHGVQVMKAARLATAASMPLSVVQPWLLHRLRPHIVHLHAPYPLGEMANWLLGRARATVLTYHSDIVRQRRLLRLYAPWLRRVLQAADMIITTSPHYLATSPWLQAVKQRCTVVPLGVDLGRFVMTRRQPHTPLRLLFVGRLRYYKGLDTLLQAMCALPRVQLQVVGEGPLRQSWQLLAQQLGIAARVEFVGDIADAHLPAAYADADVFVLPANARAEAFGTVLLEAMATGLPVISTDLGTGTSWVNQDGVTGRVVAASDPGALAQAIRELAGDLTTRQRMGQAARARVESDFSLPVMVQGVEAVYARALQNAHTL